jgi:hypothetical protein
LRERRWTEFANAKLPVGSATDPEGVWIAEGSDGDRALKFARELARVSSPFVRTRSDGGRGYFRSAEVGADLLAMLQFVNESSFRWDLIPQGTPQFAAWQRRFVEWVGKPRALKIGEAGIRVPCPWPPKKDGTIYRSDEAAPGESAAAHDAQCDGKPGGCAI